MRRMQPPSIDPDTQALWGRLNHDPAGLALLILVIAMLSGAASVYAARGATDGLTVEAIGRAVVNMVVTGLLQN